MGSRTVAIAESFVLSEAADRQRRRDSPRREAIRVVALGGEAKVPRSLPTPPIDQAARAEDVAGRGSLSRAKMRILIARVSFSAATARTSAASTP